MLIPHACALAHARPTMLRIPLLYTVGIRLPVKRFFTSVLSHNCLKSISVEKLTKLTKLSLSHNSLRAIPDVQVWNQTNCVELRVNPAVVV